MSTQSQVLAENGPVRIYETILGELADKARKAVQQNKPVMHDYHLTMLEKLSAWFSDVTWTDGGFAGAALALIQCAQTKCPRMGRRNAALLWAQSVYAARILRAWGIPVERKERSLEWFRKKAA